MRRARDCVCSQSFSEFRIKGAMRCLCHVRCSCRFQGLGTLNPKPYGCFLWVSSQPDLSFLYLDRIVSPRGLICGLLAEKKAMLHMNHSLNSLKGVI